MARGESLLGPWGITGARRIPVPGLHAARLRRDWTGEWQVLSFDDGNARDAFVGEISDTTPLGELGLL